MQCQCNIELCPEHAKKCSKEATKVIEVNRKRYHLCEACFHLYFEVKRGKFSLNSLLEED